MEHRLAAAAKAIADQFVNGQIVESADRWDYHLARVALTAADAVASETEKVGT
jgi:hypothetical protein